MTGTTVKRILIGAVVPVLVYYAGRRLGFGLAGAVLASTWGLGVLAWSLWRRGEVDGFSAVGAAYCLAELAALLITRDPDWYLFAPIASDFVMGAVFLGSMVLSRPLIQLLAEQTAGPDAFSERVRTSGFYRPLWLRLSLCWGGVYLLKGIGAWAVLVSAPVAVYLAVRVALGWPVIAAMIAFSFWYPKRYWRRRLASATCAMQGE